VIRVEFSFDDGSIYDLRVADMMASYGYNATFYVPVNWQRYLLAKHIDPLTPNDLKNIASHFTLGSHGVNHELLTRVSSETQDKEILGSMLYWQEQGYNVQSFCPPRGYFDDNIKAKVMKAGYKSMRTVNVGALSPADDPFETDVTVHIGYDREVYETDWLTYAKSKMDEALDMAGRGEEVVYSCFGHSEEIHRYQQWDRVGTLLKLLSERLR
jgi:peptidoglycan/xylan/chitin deacetylase (PgdA/CDA1 family)